MTPDNDKFWRENVRPGTTFGPYSRQATPWMKFCDWVAAWWRARG